MTAAGTAQSETHRQRERGDDGRLTIRCDRCGAAARRLSYYIASFVMVRAALVNYVCTTPGCVDEDGRTDVYVEQPGGLTLADHKWLRSQHRLLDEWIRTERAVLKAMEAFAS